jgi:hypothetical protein
MSLRKCIYFKPLCLLVAALFTTQCITYERKLVSTEEKAIENGIPAYVYELEKIKIPSSQDPMLEYRIVKFPANRVESINTYHKIKKPSPWASFKGGAVVGAIVGNRIGQSQIKDYCQDFGKPIVGSLIGALLGGTVFSLFGRVLKKESRRKQEIKEPSRSIFTKKTGSIPIPVQYFPLELKWGTRGKSNSFKTQTDEQGLVRINLIDDLKIAKFPSDNPLILYIYFLNQESQLKEILRDSLEPEK